MGAFLLEKLTLMKQPRGLAQAYARTRKKSQ